MSDLFDRLRVYCGRVICGFYGTGYDNRNRAGADMPGAAAVDGPDSLAPAVFWLAEYGTPVAKPTWKDLFRTANLRCQSQGVALWAYAHLLRHTRIFGDPLDWVRRRLGHRSVVTTQVYLHVLAELEMHTRMALVSDEWEDPRDSPPDALPEDSPVPESVTG
jgi:hypothetical protein